MKGPCLRWQALRSVSAGWMPLIHIKRGFGVSRSFLSMPLSLERTMARATIAYLEQRYTVLEKEIADALRDCPTDDRAIADLKYRKRIIANEILDNRRLVERFRKRVAH